ncbi:uncharacterized protein [Apostichopus japonicus]|uniref:uncharacterized protein isoform X4 n=1 Tax=Stichopus japonicus TaxID=307972 RepID=UPI003AB696C0
MQARTVNLTFVRESARYPCCTIKMRAVEIDFGSLGQVANEDREEAMAEQEADVQQRKQRARGESPSMTNKSPVLQRADVQQRRKRARGESRSMTNKSPVCRKYIKWSESASKCVVENFESYIKGLAGKKLPSRNEIEDFLEEGAIDHMFDWWTVRTKIFNETNKHRFRERARSVRMKML